MTASRGMDWGQAELIDQRAAKGNRREDCESLIAAHSDENLVAALVYQGFATERGARSSSPDERQRHRAAGRLHPGEVPVAQAMCPQSAQFGGPIG